MLVITLVAIALLLLGVLFLLLALVSIGGRVLNSLAPLQAGISDENGDSYLASILTMLAKDAMDRVSRQTRRDAREEETSRRKRYERSEQVGREMLHFMENDPFFKGAEVIQNKYIAAEHGVFRFHVRRGNASAEVSVYPELPLSVHISGLEELHELEHHFSATDIAKAVLDLRNGLLQKERR